VVNKEARVTEEVVVRKRAEERTQTVCETVRRTKVEVEDERGRTGTTERPDKV
jgi:stress response protein YsnF